jgi:spore coat protein B
LKVKLEYLEELKNKSVNVFKGGPESKEGVLLDVKSDYLMLRTEEGDVFYQLKHVKSVIENSKGPVLLSAETKLPEEKTFYSLLKSYLNYNIQIDRGGPECRQGLLLDVRKEHLVLMTADEGVIYYQLEHIKSLSEVIKEVPMEEEGLAESPSGITFTDDLTVVNTMVEEVKPNMIEKDKFKEMLEEMKYSWVTINRGGPEKIEGVLVDIGDDYIAVVKGKKISRITTFHIKNISQLIKEVEEKEEKEQKEKDQQNESSDNNEEDSNEKKDENKNKDKDKKSKNQSLKGMGTQNGLTGIPSW